MKVLFKILFFLLGCCIIVIMAVASNSAWFEKGAAYAPSPFRYGDLYLVSSMPGYKINTHIELKPPFNKQTKNVALTIIGDSYTDKFDSTHFNAGSYRFIHWNNIPDTVLPIDRTKKNIIIVSSTERYARWRFTKDQLLTFSTQIHPHADQTVVDLAAELNLQYLLTHLDWQDPFKELKTSIYLKYFDKFSPAVAKPDGTGRLYLSETTDPKNNASSFNPVNDAEIKTLRENMNKISEQLCAIGYDEVYFSIIPNAASLYKTSEIPYNHLIERLQQHPDVKFKFIDVYDSFKQEKNSVFLCNDSHWNALGRMIWLIKANELLDHK